MVSMVVLVVMAWQMVPLARSPPPPPPMHEFGDVTRICDPEDLILDNGSRLVDSGSPPCLHRALAAAWGARDRSLEQPGHRAARRDGAPA